VLFLVLVWHKDIDIEWYKHSFFHDTRITRRGYSSQNTTARRTIPGICRGRREGMRSDLRVARDRREVRNWFSGVRSVGTEEIIALISRLILSSRRQISIRSMRESRLASSNVPFDEHLGGCFVNYSRSSNERFEGRDYASVPNIKMARLPIVETAIAPISSVPRKKSISRKVHCMNTMDCLV